MSENGDLKKLRKKMDKLESLSSEADSYTFVIKDFVEWLKKAAVLISTNFNVSEEVAVQHVKEWVVKYINSVMK